MTVDQLEARFPFLKLLCDQCHTKFTSDIGESSAFTVCDRCWIKINAYAAAQR
jgi:hypothetical protein